MPDAAALMTDPRVRHYWDPGDRVGRLYAPVLGTDEPAWDVWLLFGRDARWEADVPEPGWWEHQLSGLPAERRLDPGRFAEKAGELLVVRPRPASIENRTSIENRR